MTLPVITTMALLAVAASACGRTEPAVERLPYPVAAQRRRRRRLRRDESRRSVPMDGGARFEGSGGLGRGVQCGHRTRTSRQLPLREHFNARLTELWNYPRVGVPVDRRRAGCSTRRTPACSGSRRSSSAGAQRRRRRWSSIPTSSPRTARVSLSQWSPSPDAKLLAYGLAEGGADWNTIRVRDITSGQDLPDEVQWMRFSGISWTHDGRGFFYSRYPEPPKNKVLEAALSGQALYYHRSARRSRRTG